MKKIYLVFIALSLIFLSGCNVFDFTHVDGESDDVNITIEDTTPPEVSFELIKDELWPANHKMVLVASSERRSG